MSLDKVVVWAEESVFEYVSHRAGIEVAPLNGEFKGESAAVMIIRPAGSDQLPGLLEAIARAALFDVPVVVVAGVADDAGQAIQSAARRSGIPPECIIRLRGCKIEDGCGNQLGDALRGTGIGMQVVFEQTVKALEKKQVPECPLWDASWNAGPVAAALTPAEKPLWNCSTGAEPAKLACTSVSRCSWQDYLDRADQVVAVFGIKSGVGVSTVAACLSGVLCDYGSFCLEVSPSASGYVYYANILGDAMDGKKYAYYGLSSPAPEGRLPLLVVDAGLSEAYDSIYARADCVVLVTDNSHVAFGKVGKWIKGGWRVDVLAVNKALATTGYPPEVYMGEYHLETVIGIPGGTEEETAVNLAQRNGALPFGRSVDLDNAYNELAKAVKTALKI